VSSPSPRPLPPAGRAYVTAVGLGGSALFAYCAAILARQGIGFELVVFAALTLASGRFTLKIPSIDSTLSVSEMFGFSCVLLFGPEAAAVTLALDSLVLGWRRRMTREQVLFNFGNLTLSVWISGAIFFAAAGVPPLLTAAAPSSGLLLPLALLASTYFLVNSGLTAGIVALHGNEQPIKVWRAHFLWLAPSYAAAASVALLLVVALRQVHFTAIALIPPLLFISYLTLRSSFGRLEDAKGHVEKLNRLYFSTVETLATAIDAKDEVTHSHIRRVQAGAIALAREVGVTDSQTLQAIESAALLHDTGKIAVPEHILNKPGKLTAAEFEKMKLHAPIGAEILSSIEFPYPVVPIVRHHHENWDGTGYPDGLKGTEIPIGARILSVVDCFDALTSDRPYRRRMSDDEALKIVLDRRNSMYDPAVVDAFVASYKRIMPPSDETAHPVARALGDAREAVRQSAAPPEPVGTDAPVSDEVLAVTSLARAVAGQASLTDVGALAWMMIRNVVPCTSMALFVNDEAQDTVVVRFAAGAHTGVLRRVRKARGVGIAGWASATRRGVLNADAALDLGPDAGTLSPPLRSALVAPLTHEGSCVGVLALYAATPAAFSDDQLRLLELLGPSLAASIASVSAPAEPLAVGGAALRRQTGTELRLLRR
jgi:putative nucleotidyltransferase with HDIG domain